MNTREAYCAFCVCGRSFSLPSALTLHQKSCSSSKKRLSGALEKAREVWIARKKARTCAAEPGLSTIPDPGTDAVADLQVRCHRATLSLEVDDIHLSLLERRPWTLRNRTFPAKFRDNLPEFLSAFPPADDEEAIPSDDFQVVARGIVSPSNSFGLFRRYHTTQLPSHDPENEYSGCNVLPEAKPRQTWNPPTANLSQYYPYPNASSFRLGDWYWNGSAQKSDTNFHDLVTIVGDSFYRPEDVGKANWDQINTILGQEDAGEWLDDDAGWTRTPVTISVPFHPRRGVRTLPGDGPRDFVVEDFFHRNLVSVIREKLSRPHDDALFHYEPYELHWSPPGATEDVRVHGELYTSQAFLDAHDEIQNSPPEQDCHRPRVIAALMFWSDTTHLTSFGEAKLCPLYMYFGNESKYRRCQPSSHLCEHVAYFKSLPAEFRDFARNQTAGRKSPSGPLVTHCTRELTHAQLRILLDDEFIDAWKHGMIVLCCDGTERRFYPRIFTYSADYPEKILLASIRNLGGFPCPRCLVSLSLVHQMGTPADMHCRQAKLRIDNSSRWSRIKAARKLIYEKNLQVNSAAVNQLLQEESLVPNTNAFSEKLGPLGFNMFQLFVVDLMHEWELGVGRSIFLHILRILAAQDESLLCELDRRFKLVPQFGTAIRRFTRNCSEMKQMAAHDIENILQCLLPVFEDLLPEPHNTDINRLIFVASHWHGLAKLRMHTDPTLEIQDAVTASLGEHLRSFSEQTCPCFETRELPREADARMRRESNNTAHSGSTKKSNVERDTHVKDPTAGRQLKGFNLKTYKLHSLGDYTASIRYTGTTDSTSTEPAELEHRTSKIRYSRTSRKGFIKQLTQIERRQSRIRRIGLRNSSEKATKPVEPEAVSFDLTPHYNVGRSQNTPVNIIQFVRENKGDPAVKDFMSKLKGHVLPRIYAKHLEASRSQNSGTISSTSNQTWSNVVEQDDPSALTTVFFPGDRMFQHQIMNINYTSYDVRRDQDIIHCGTNNRDVMVLASGALDREAMPATHRFWFARVLGIYHVNAVYTGSGMLDYNPRRIDFLWVRWFNHSVAEAMTWDKCELDPVHFPPTNNEESFGFLDPDDVIRCCHIIPAFARGMAQVGKKPSKLAGEVEDWRGYYINRFADRDMVMRFHWGLAVGHVYSHTGYRRKKTLSTTLGAHRGNTAVDQSKGYEPPSNLDSEIPIEEGSDVELEELMLVNREEQDLDEPGEQEELYGGESAEEEEGEE
ncbi:hypothetical protein BV25DRAFT_1872245 [Artomyces pyxidatus]|uniref:Uncharacterized protein n=1 Tax=Artomyces pyxidatus TaxID=48021 RepID=A0ACB8SND7_9AGAM|nr:hypothetical protein BV25DRAFT_1872245 [Artomyces pyxidatus]